MIIPRENNLVRLYIQIATSTDKDFNPRKQATPEEVQAAAQKILQPYYIEWDQIEWYSVYPIGQGIAEKYTLDYRIFLGGDCCHTHSVSQLPLLYRSMPDLRPAQSRSRYEYRLPRCSELGMENKPRRVWFC